MTITLATLFLGLAIFTLQILATEAMRNVRSVSAEIDRSFGTCDRVFPSFHYSPEPQTPTFRKHLKP